MLEFIDFVKSCLPFSVYARQGLRAALHIFDDVLGAASPLKASVRDLLNDFLESPLLCSDGPQLFLKTPVSAHVRAHGHLRLTERLAELLLQIARLGRRLLLCIAFLFQRLLELLDLLVEPPLVLELLLLQVEHVFLQRDGFTLRFEVDCMNRAQFVLQRVAFPVLEGQLLVQIDAILHEELQHLREVRLQLALSDHVLLD